MGCGTGARGPGEPFEFVIRFHPPIPSDKAVYLDFKSAVFWLTQGLQNKSTMDDLVEDPPGPGARDIIRLTVKMRGPLADPQHFNRAFNRVLWGIRHRLHEPGTGREEPGTSSHVSVTATPVNWTNEDT